MVRLYEGHKRILVTGGAGFIGSHPIDQWLRDLLSLFQALGGGWLPPPPKGHAAQVQ